MPRTKLPSNTVASLRAEAKTAYARGKGNKALKGYGSMKKDELERLLGVNGTATAKPTKLKTSNKQFGAVKTANRVDRMTAATEKLGGREEVLKTIKKAVQRVRRQAKKEDRVVTPKELRSAAFAALREKAKLVKTGSSNTSSSSTPRHTSFQGVINTQDNTPSDWQIVQTTPKQRSQYRQTLKKLEFDSVADDYTKTVTPPPHGEELAALTVYSGGSFRNMNRLLRGQELHREDTAKYQQTLPRLKQHIEMATAALNGLPKYEGTVYRGTDLDPEQISRYKVGETITEHGFTSSSYSKDAAYRGNTRFIIASKSGSQIDKFAPYAHEKEVLFKPGTKFKVLKTRKERGRQTFYLEELN